MSLYGNGPNAPKLTACDNCYRLHRKCGGETPKCGLCKRTNVECTYVRRFVTPSLIKGRQRDREDEINAKLAKTLQKRVDELERTVQVLLNELIVAKTALNSQGSPAIGLVDILLDLAFPNNQYTSNTNTAANSILQHTSQGLQFDHSFISAPSPPASQSSPPVPPASGSPAWLNAVENAFQHSMHLHNPVTTNGEGLPMSRELSGGRNLPAMEGSVSANVLASDEERDELLKIYFDVGSRYVMQIVHEGWFWKRLRSPNPPSRVLVLTMCAVAASCSPAEDGSLWPSEMFFEPTVKPRAEALMNAAILCLDLEHPSVEMCQALVLMVLLQGSLKDPRTSQEWLLSGMAMRMVPLLKLDVDPDLLERMDPTARRWPWIEKETRRRVFAIICMLDEIDMALREACFGVWKRKHAVKVPAVLAVWHSVDVETGEPALDPSKVSAVDISLLALAIANLRARVAELNQAMGSSYKQMKMKLEIGDKDAAGGADPTGDREPTKLDITPELQFALLDAELDLWYQSLPPGLHPSTLTNDIQFSFVIETKGERMAAPFQALRLHLLYMASMLSLHRPRVLRELKSLTAIMLLNNVTDRSLLVISDGCKDSLRKCAQAAVGITQMMKRKIMITHPSPLNSAIRPFASFARMSPGFAISLLEAGIMHAVFLVMLGIGSFPHQTTLLTPEMRARVTEMVSGIVGDTFKLAAVEGLSIVMQILKGLSKQKKQVALLSDVLDRVIAKIGLENYMQSVPELSAHEDPIGNYLY
ncbi:hypothetical protein HK101_010515 [Irineochytrium annulatum]|nr:hypothetical protein HK101_010515 [Irineochytrium annulatum]